MNALITLWLYYPLTASPHTTTMFYYPTKWCFYWRHKITIRAAHYYFQTGKKVDLYQPVSFPVRLIPFSLWVIYFCVVDRTLTRWCRDDNIRIIKYPCSNKLRFLLRWWSYDKKLSMSLYYNDEKIGSHFGQLFWLDLTQ